MRVKQINNSDKEKWDEFVCSHPNASPYHCFAWIEAIEKAYKLNKIAYSVESAGNIVAILPIVVLKIPFRSPKLVSLPYCDLGSILATDYNAIEPLLMAAKKQSNDIKANSFEIHGELPIELMPTNYGHVHTRQDKVRMLLDLPDSSEHLWQGFKSKLRSQIKKAEKNGLRFEISNHKLNDFYSVFSTNMRDLGSPVHSLEMFHTLIKEYGERAKLGLVYDGKEPIGCGIVLRVNKSITIPWASTLRSHNRLNPNMLLYWGFLKYATDHGCISFDFGRSTPDEGTYRFKKQWGAKPYPLLWSTIHFNSAPSSPSQNQERKRQTLATIWQKLPVPLATYCGSKLRKYISL